MIDTSAAYKTAILADFRQFVPKVEVYFDGDSQPPVEFNGDDIAGINLLEELQAESDNPLGLVSANECTIVFDNSNRDFTPTNTSSPYFGKLKPYMLIKPYLGLILPDTSVEYIPLGIFRTGDWRSPAGSVEATVTSYDRIYQLGQKEVPMLAMVKNTSVAELFAILFDALGLDPDEYDIGVGLNDTIAMGYIPKGDVHAALQYLAMAGGCTVKINRTGVIEVRSNFVIGDPDVTWTDTNQVKWAENPMRELDAYSKVRVNYKEPYLDPAENLFAVNNFQVPNGGITFTNAEFTAGPVACVKQVRLIGAVNSEIVNIAYGAWTITIEISNIGPAEIVSLEVLASDVDFAGFDQTVEDNERVLEYGIKELLVDNNLIQTQDVALRYANNLLQYVSDPGTYFRTAVRGDPAVETGDIVRIQDPSDKIGTVDVFPYRIALDFDGALEETIEARKVVIPRIWAFISPGLYVYVAKAV